MARTIDHLGNGMAPIALSFAILDLTGSITDVGIVVGTRSCATVALLLLGGMLADRLPRQVVLQGSALLAFASQGCAAASVLWGFSSVPLLAVVGALNGAAAAASLPAASALTPRTVPASDLRQANALVRTGISAATIVGAALGGVMVAAIGPGWALAVDAVSFLAVAFCFAGLLVAPAPHTATRLRFWHELREGWTAFTAHSWIWVIVLQFLVVNAVASGTIRVLGPAIADETIGRTAWGLVLAAHTAGAVAGGLLAVRWRPRRALFLGVAMAELAALPILMLAHYPHVMALVAIMFIVGVAIQLFAIAWEVSLQTNIPDAALARVYSYDALGSFLAIPAGQLAAGPMANAFGTATTLTAGAVLITVATVGAVLVPSVRSQATMTTSASDGRSHGEG